MLPYRNCSGMILPSKNANPNELVEKVGVFRPKHVKDYALPVLTTYPSMSVGKFEDNVSENSFSKEPPGALTRITFKKLLVPIDEDIMV